MQVVLERIPNGSVWVATVPWCTFTERPPLRMETYHRKGDSENPSPISGCQTLEKWTYALYTIFIITISISCLANTWLKVLTDSLEHEDDVQEVWCSELDFHSALILQRLLSQWPLVPKWKPEWKQIISKSQLLQSRGSVNKILPLMVKIRLRW